MYSLEELRHIAYRESPWGDISKLADILFDELGWEGEVPSRAGKEGFIELILEEQQR